MGEAKRKAAARARASASRSWATGSIRVIANNKDCFTWSGTRDEAVALQKRYLDTMNMAVVDCQSYAKRAAAYLMVYGMPRAGDIDHRPSNLGQPWASSDIEAYKAATLWLALREHIPNTGQKVEDMFVGKKLAVYFTGDEKLIRDDTLRELRGEALPSGDEFQMMVAVLSDRHRLDPRDAVVMKHGEIWALAGAVTDDERLANETVYVPRFPVDAAEAEAMLALSTIFADASDPESLADPEHAIRIYIGSVQT